MSYIIDICEDTGYGQYVDIDMCKESHDNNEYQKHLDNYETMMEYGLINSSDFQRPYKILGPLYILLQIFSYWFAK